MCLTDTHTDRQTHCFGIYRESIARAVKTALDRGLVMTYPHAKVQGQRSVGSEDRVKTNGRTDGQTDGDERITSHANVVCKYATDSDFFNVRTHALDCWSSKCSRWPCQSSWQSILSICPLAFEPWTECRKQHELLRGQILSTFKQLKGNLGVAVV